MLNLANVRMWRRDYAEADSLARHALEIYMRTLGEKNPTTALSWARLAYIHHLQGDNRTANREVTQARAMFLANGLPPNHPELTRTSTLQGLILTKLGRLAPADSMLRHAMEIRMVAYKPGDARRWETMTALGVTLAAEGMTAEATPLLAQARTEFERLFGGTDPRTQWAARLEAEALNRSARVSNAR